MTKRTGISKLCQLFIIFALVVSLITPFSINKANAAEFVETFDNSTNTSTSYSFGSFTGVNGVEWTYQGRGNLDSYAIDGNGLLFRDKDVNYIKSNEISGGIGSFSIDYKTAFTGKGTRQIEVFVNDVSIGVSPEINETNTTTNTYKIENINIDGEFTLKIVNATSKQVVIDNIRWTSYEGSEPVDETQVPAVKADPPSGVVSLGTEVELTTATADTTIFYTLDKTEPTRSSTKYTEPIEINETTTVKAFAIKDGLTDSNVSTFEYTIVAPPTVLSIAEARQQGMGEEVIVKGVVTALLKNTLHFQDGTAALAVYPKLNGVQAGDEITVKGTLSDHRGLLQLQNATLVGEPVAKDEVEPIVLTGAEINEENESKLATVKNVTISGSAQNYNATDGNGTFVVRDENNDLGLVEGTTYESITGIVQQFNDNYQIIPRSSADIIVDTTTLKPAIATPGAGTFVGEQSVTLSTTTAGAEIYYTVDGKDPITEGIKYEAPIAISETTTIKTVVKAQDGTFSEVKEFEYKITDGLRIHDLQGEGHTSPFIGETVNVKGIVTYTFTLNNSHYYTIQTPDREADNNPNTSEAILLYAGKNPWPIQIGDLVEVTGKVDEYAYDGYTPANERQLVDLKTTQINVRNDQGGNVKVIESGLELPLPIVLDESNINFNHIEDDAFTAFEPKEDAIDFWESIEGMRVEVEDVKAIAPQEHGDLITVLESVETNSLHGGILYEEGQTNPNRIQFRMEPNGSARDFDVKTGDKFEGPITGIVGYSFQNFKIYVSLDEMKANHSEGTVQPEQTTITFAEDKLTIASYNLENFSNNTRETSNDKAQKLARAIGTDMGNPDIIGVTEVQDNNGSSEGGTAANESYERLIKAIEAESGVKYEYLNIDPLAGQDGGAPNANIRVGFLYNPERVSLPEGIGSGNATTAVGYENGNLTLNPGRIDPTNDAFYDSRKPLAAQFEFNGEQVIVIVNHWNSKTGDTPLFGAIQPPKTDSEIQRKKIAEVVYGFVEDIKEANPDAYVVSVGDFNDYEFAEALKIHEGELMTNMINKIEDKDRYTYLYQGNSQVLDHILVSNNLVNKTKIDILHINADFTDGQGRASDHDPVMVQIDFDAEPVAEPIVAEKIYNFTDFKTQKLIFTKPSVEVHLDGDSVITNGLIFKGQYIELHGEGFAEHDVVIQPAENDAIVDLKGTTVKKLTIDGTNVKEIRGAENATIEYINGASAESIMITDSEGAPIGDPSFPSKAPEVALPIPNKTLVEGEVLNIVLTDHFSDPNNDALTFSATTGTINGNELSLSLLEGIHTITVTATDDTYSVSTTFVVTVTPQNESADYYEEAEGKSGTQLKSTLHEIISEHEVLSYSQVWDALKITDEDPNNPNNVLLFYSGISRSKNLNGGNVGNWNREHVWAKSHGGFGTSNGPGTDIHHLRATDMQVNSSRGSLDFDNGGSANVKSCSECKRDGDSFEPPNHVKGDVARMLFYMAVRYEPGDRVDLELNNNVSNGSKPYHGKLSVLLEWHENDPVDDIERNRNEKIYEIQGNRNPFIDHPEWASLIWQ